MFETLFDNTSMPVLQQVLAFSELRQQVLAHNVANINTPGFRQTDLDVLEFTGALGKAIDSRNSETPRRFGMKDGRTIRYSGGRMRAEAQTIDGLMNYYDSADRGIEHLQNEMLKNAIWHETASRLFSQQTRLLKTAIRGQMS